MAWRRVLAMTAIALSMASCAATRQPDQFGNAYDSDTYGSPYHVSYPTGGYTYATSSRSHGIQIQYFAEDGRNYLWYPTGANAVPGTWRKTDQGDVCFAYGPATYNPVTKKRAAPGEEGCRQSKHLGTIISRVEGDPFDLASGSLPDFDLTKCRLPAPMKLNTDDWTCEPKDASWLESTITQKDLDRASEPHFHCLIAYMGKHGDMVSDAGEIAKKLAGECRAAGFEFPFRDALLAVEAARAMVHSGGGANDP